MTERDPPGHLGHPHPGDIPAHGLFVERWSALLSAIADLDRPCDKAARRHVYDRTRDLLFSHLCETMLKPAQGGRGSLSLDEIKEVRAALEETIVEVEAITSRPGWTATRLHDGPLEAVHDGPREPRSEERALQVSDFGSAQHDVPDGEHEAAIGAGHLAADASTRATAPATKVIGSILRI
jgi:hypothetical protein